MSKVIRIFAVFVLIFAALGITAFNFLPKTLSIFEREIISACKNQGFLKNIERTKFLFPDKILFENAEVKSAVESGFTAKISQSALNISIVNYAKALFKLKINKEKIVLSEFSDYAQLSDISLFYNEETIFSQAKAELNLGGSNLKYGISADKFNYGGFSASKLEINGVLDGALTNFTAKIEIFCGLVNIFSDYDLQKNNLEINRIELQNMDLQQIIPLFADTDADISGALFGEIIPEKLPKNFANIDEIIRQTEAKCSLSVKNFKFDGKKYSQAILDAVYFVGIKDLNFQELTADFDYSYANSRVKNLLADNFKYSVSSSGFFIPKTHKFNFDTEIHFNPDMKSVIQKNIWNSMLSDEPNGQGRKLSGKISGNADKISVSLDGEIVKKGVNSILSEIKDIFR